MSNTTTKQRDAMRATMRSLLTEVSDRDIDRALRLRVRRGLTIGDAVNAVTRCRDDRDHLAMRRPRYIERLIAERDSCTTERARGAVLLQAQRWASGLFWRYGLGTAYVGLPGGAGWAEHHAWLRRIGDEAA